MEKPSNFQKPALVAPADPSKPGRKVVNARFSTGIQIGPEVRTSLDAAKDKAEMWQIPAGILVSMPNLKNKILVFGSHCLSAVLEGEGQP